MSARNQIIILFILILCQSLIPSIVFAVDYPVVDTNQQDAYNDGDPISAPGETDSFYGQDSQYSGYQPCYEDNGDGTVSDTVTGLMWTQDPGSRVSWSQGISNVDSLNDENFAGYDDWRVPTVKELYSLILFSGTDVSSAMDSTDGAESFIANTYFSFAYGESPWRFIDAQYISSTVYTGTVMEDQSAFFGVNFADGRIKGYGKDSSTEQYYAHYVRGNEKYGINDFSVDGNLVTDASTGLVWMKEDSGGSGMVWEDALNYCEDLEVDGYTDWRLPNAKELQSIVDYTRSPDETNSASIAEVFNATGITNEAGEDDFPWYWTSTTHVLYETDDAPIDAFAGAAVYIAFGRSLGNYYGDGNWIDVHGSGSQRSDPKTGDPDEYEDGWGPQGDAIRIYNHVRCVRGGGESSACDDLTTTSKAANLGQWFTAFGFTILFATYTFLHNQIF
mmetsp:Transcript_17076/g.22554  ORF Transcript_17076/g.22554 Transcript_17076/m.22554 type:complete len:447 (-) Transcript_17076:352-1692(-)